MDCISNHLQEIYALMIRPIFISTYWSYEYYIYYEASMEAGSVLEHLSMKIGFSLQIIA